MILPKQSEKTIIVSDSKNYISKKLNDIIEKVASSQGAEDSSRLPLNEI